MEEKEINVHLNNIAVAVNRVVGNFEELSAIRNSFEAIKKFMYENKDTPVVPISGE